MSRAPTLSVEDEVLRAIEERRLADLITVIAAPEEIPVHLGSRMLVDAESGTWGTLGDPALDRGAVEDAGTAIGERKSQVRSYDVPWLGVTDQVEAFHEILEPTPQLLILGAGHIAVPLARFARAVGFEVVVVDDRDKYANQERFPDADRVIAADFGETLRDFMITPFSYVVIITRAHSYDEESLRVLLHRPAAYIGMIGSRRRVQTVLRTLAAEGYDQDRLRAIYAPIGLDIGSETPEEIALAIIAEVVAVHRGGTGRPISRQIRPIAMQPVAGGETDE